jgi:hypothetical protein
MCIALIGSGFFVALRQGLRPLSRSIGVAFHLSAVFTSDFRGGQTMRAPLRKESRFCGLRALK